MNGILVYLLLADPGAIRKTASAIFSNSRPPGDLSFKRA